MRSFLCGKRFSVASCAVAFQVTLITPFTIVLIIHTRVLHSAILKCRHSGLIIWTVTRQFSGDDSSGCLICARKTLLALLFCLVRFSSVDSEYLKLFRVVI